MKKIIIGIIIVILIGAGYLILNNPTPNNPELNQVPTDAILESGEYTITPETTVNWQANRPLMENYQDTGTIAISQGNVSVTDQGVTGTIQLDMSSIAALTTGTGGGQEGLTRHLKSADFFEVETYPTAIFVISEVTETENQGTYTAQGNLTLKETTLPLSFPVTLYTEGDVLHINGIANVDRTLWGVQYGSGKFFDSIGEKMINDIFTVVIDITAQK